MTQGEKNYLKRLEIELEGLKLCKHSGSTPRSQQEKTIQKNINLRADRKQWIERQIKLLKSKDNELQSTYKSIG